MSSLNRDTALRLAKDIRNLKKNPLHDNGIYYEHDEENMLHGRAMIIGPTNTPYQYGFYLFKIEFTNNYPAEPPKLIYCTQGNNIRFHPNLYRSGKVCVSILNTWKGEQWSSCQTISTILLTIATLLDDKPLLNEPGITENHYDFHKFNEIITYSNFNFSIIDLFLNIDEKYKDFSCFKDQIKNSLKDNYKEIEKLIKEYKEKEANIKLVKTNLYNLNCEINYTQLAKNFKKIKSKLK